MFVLVLVEGLRVTAAIFRYICWATSFLIILPFKKNKRPLLAFAWSFSYCKAPLRVGYDFSIMQRCDVKWLTSVSYINMVFVDWAAVILVIWDVEIPVKTTIWHNGLLLIFCRRKIKERKVTIYRAFVSMRQRLLWPLLTTRCLCHSILFIREV